MRTPDRCMMALAGMFFCSWLINSAIAQSHEHEAPPTHHASTGPHNTEPHKAHESQPSAADLPTHHETANDDADSANQPDDPSLPEGMTLDEVLDRAASPPPDHFPNPVPDNELRYFTLIEQLEYRIADEGKDEFGWDAQGWIGFDYDKFWWKSEGEAAFDGMSEGESQTDFLYSRLITPFWNAQVGVQYANEWDSGEYSDRWSGVLALEGLTPGLIELDSSLYISEDADVTLELEAEYDLRITQRLVLQPRAEAGFAFQDVPDRQLGSGLTEVNLDLRLRYEVEREIAPYIGVRYGFLAGETANNADAAGVDTEQLYFIFGFRIAF